MLAVGILLLDTVICEEDFDSDGIPDSWERKYGLRQDKYSAADDPDYDLLPNIDEYKQDTNPLMRDTDMDGINDLKEIVAGYDPKDANSRPTEDIIQTLNMIIIVLLVAVLFLASLYFFRYHQSSIMRRK